MSTITIDGTEYNVDDLSSKAKAQLRSLQLIDQKLADLQRDLIIYQSAARGYSSVLSGQLPATEAHPNKKKGVVEIDGKRYTLDSFSDDGRAHLDSLLATNARISAVQQEVTIVQTARNVHGTALKSEIN